MFVFITDGRGRLWKHRGDLLHITQKQTLKAADCLVSDSQAD